MGYLSFCKKLMILVSHDGTRHKDYRVSVAVTEYCRLLCPMTAQAIKTTVWVLQLQNIAGCCVPWRHKPKLMILVPHEGTSHKDYSVSVAVTEYCRLLVYLFLSFSLFLLLCCACWLLHSFIHSFKVWGWDYMCACFYARYSLFMYVLFPGTQHPCSLTSPVIIFGIPSVVWYRVGLPLVMPNGFKAVLKSFFLNNEPDALIIQIYSGIKLYMFRASSLPIIRSSLLYIRHW
jgi:hypothetical protein